VLAATGRHTRIPFGKCHIEPPDSKPPGNRHLVHRLLVRIAIIRSHHEGARRHHHHLRAVRAIAECALGGLGVSPPLLVFLLLQHGKTDDHIPTEIATRLKMRAEQLHVRVLTLSQQVRAGAEGLARLAAKALTREELTLAHTSLL
jgi:hypothetical protein